MTRKILILRMAAVLLAGFCLTMGMQALAATYGALTSGVVNGTLGNQDPTSPAVLEGRLQALTWPQMESLINNNDDLKAIVAPYGAMGMAYIQSQYKTFKWSNNISNWALSSRERLVAALDQVTGTTSPAGPTVEVVAAKIRALGVAQAQAFICADAPLQAFVANLPSSFQDGLKQDHTTFGWESYLKAHSGDLAKLSDLADKAKANGLSACPAPMVAAKPNPGLAGKLLREPKSGGTYVVDRAGLRRWITNPQVFADCGLDWGQVENQPEAAINAVAEGHRLETAEACREVRPSQPNGLFAGRLLKIASDARVYLIGRDGYRYWIANPTAFTSCGLDWGRIETLPPSQVFAIAAGNPPGLNDARECAARR